MYLRNNSVLTTSHFTNSDDWNGLAEQFSQLFQNAVHAFNHQDWAKHRECVSGCRDILGQQVDIRLTAGRGTTKGQITQSGPAIN